MESIIFAKKHIHLESIDSTNSYANQLLSTKNLPEGTVISAGQQTQGKGQRGNSWISSPNENLTFSLVLKPGFLAVKDQFQLTLFSSLGCADYVSSHLQNQHPLADIRIKWPNDLLVNRKKVAGILTENQLLGDQLRISILGIGLNVNQLFSGSVFEATSLSELTGLRYNVHTELNNLCAALEKRYLQLRGNGADKLKTDYLELLFGKDELLRYRIQGKEEEGIITGVSTEGKLEMQLEKGKKSFGNQEIEFII